MITSMEALDPLYTTHVRCSCCETPFTTARMRSSFKKATHMDSDFCSYYNNDNNPDYYVVRYVRTAVLRLPRTRLRP